MVSITLSIPEDIRNRMKQFPEVNWSALIRKIVEEKIKQLLLKEDLLSKLKEEKERGFNDWTIEMGDKLKRSSIKNSKKDRGY